MFNDNLFVTIKLWQFFRDVGTLFIPLIVHAGVHPLLYILFVQDSSQNQSSPPPTRPKDSSRSLAQFADETIFWFSSTEQRHLVQNFTHIYQLLRIQVVENPTKFIHNYTSTSDPVLQPNSAYDSFRAIPWSSRVLNLYPPQPALT